MVKVVKVVIWSFVIFDFGLSFWLTIIYKY